jgi:hypothetical protein
VKLVYEIPQLRITDNIGDGKYIVGIMHDKYVLERVEHTVYDEFFKDDI